MVINTKNTAMAYCHLHQRYLSPRINIDRETTIEKNRNNFENHSETGSILIYSNNLHRKYFINNHQFTRQLPAYDELFPSSLP